MTRFFLSLLLVLLAATAQAQPNPDRTITLDEAIRLALQRNTDVQRARIQVEGAEVGVARQRANFLPDLSLGTSASRYYGLSFDQTTGNVSQEMNDRLNVGASSSVMIFDGFSNLATLRQANALLDASEHRFERTQETVSYTVMNEFLQVLLAQELVRIAAENLEAQQQQLAQVEEFVRVGRRPRSDLYQQQQLTAEAEVEILTRESGLQVAKINLVQTLGLEPFGSYTFVAPPPDQIALLPEAFDPDQLLRHALGQRADLQAQQAQIDAARQGIRAARGDYFPSLSISGSYGTSYSSIAPVALEDQFNQNRGGGFTFNLGIPIFNRFAVRNSVQQAQIQYENARLTYEDQRRQAALEVQQALSDYDIQRKRLDATEKRLQYASAALEAEEERYRLGASSLVDLATARANYVSAASQRAQAIYQFLFQRRVVEYQAGLLNPQAPVFEGR